MSECYFYLTNIQRPKRYLSIFITRVAVLKSSSFFSLTRIDQSQAFLYVDNRFGSATLACHGHHGIEIRANRINLCTGIAWIPRKHSSINAVGSTLCYGSRGEMRRDLGSCCVDSACYEQVYPANMKLTTPCTRLFEISLLVQGPVSQYVN